MDVHYGSIKGEPYPLDDGRVEVSILPYVRWECTCGKICTCYEYTNLTMVYECQCSKWYEVGWSHGLKPKVRLLHQIGIDEADVLFQCALCGEEWLFNPLMFDNDPNPEKRKVIYCPGFKVH